MSRARKQKRKRFQARVNVTGVQTHHFFAVHPDTFMPTVRDPDGSILVYTDRNQAEDEAHERLGEDTVVCIVGMGDDKWAMFQAEQKYRVVPERPRVVRR
jgi:hypothetical protein